MEYERGPLPIPCKRAVLKAKTYQFETTMKNQKSLPVLLSLLLAATVAPAQQPTATNSPPRQRASGAIPMTSLRAAGTPAAAPTVTLLKAGANAADFTSKNLAAREVRLADFKDKVVVLDFWATWCGPCMKSLPHTQEVAKHYKDRGVVVLANCTSDTRAKFEAWVNANQVKYPDIFFTCDPNERGSATFDERASKKLYGVSGIPTQFVIGRDGKIAAALVGYSDGDARLEAGLARAGIKVDPAVAAKGEAQIKKSEEAAAAARTKAAPAPAKPPLQ